MKALAQVNVGIRTDNFKGALRFFSEVLNMELVYCDEEIEFVQLRLPSGEMMELFGLKNLWHPFTNSPEWELMIVDMAAGKDQVMKDSVERDGFKGPDSLDLDLSKLFSRSRWEDL